MDSRDGKESERDRWKRVEIEEIPSSSAQSGEDLPAGGSNQHPVVEIDDGGGSSIHREQLGKNQDNNAVNELLFPAKIHRSSSSSSNPREDASGFSHESTAMDSPPVQVMDRSEGYDASRIPSSVFQTNASSIPMDWSSASNDSMFSINVDGSFTKDPFRRRGPLGSGEFLPFSPSMTGYSPYLPSTESNKNLESEADEASPTTSGTKLASSNQKELKTQTKNTNESGTSSNVSTTSSSMNSTHSFAFPVLLDDASKDFVKGEPPMLQQQQRRPQQQQQQQKQQPQQQQQHHPIPEVTLKPLTRKSWFSWCCCNPHLWTYSQCCQHRPRYCHYCCCCCCR